MIYYALQGGLAPETDLDEGTSKSATRNEGRGARGRGVVGHLRRAIQRFDPKSFRSFAPDPSASSEGTEPEQSASTVPFEKIGLNKPLCIDIRTVYTGRHPGGLFGSVRPALVTSAVKGWSAWDSQALAVNILRKKVGRKAFMTNAASEPGSSIVYYSPAVTERQLLVDISVVFDEFPQEVFEAVSSAFTSAGGLPVFASHAGALLGAGAGIRIGAAIVESLFDRKPAFFHTERIDLLIAGREMPEGGYVLAISPEVELKEPNFGEKYEVRDERLTNRTTGEQYAGDYPYVVLALDGRVDDALAQWAPHAASVALLERFYGDANAAFSLELLVEAMQLYNDMLFRKRLDELDDKISHATTEEERMRLVVKREAVATNISNKLLKKA